MSADICFADVIKEISRRAIVENPEQKEKKWSDAEIRFLRENHSRMLDAEMGLTLGRSEIAVKIFRTRLRLPAASRAKVEWVSLNEAANILGVDMHAFSGWCDAGLLPFKLAGLNQQIRLVRRKVLDAWAVNPMNWVYFAWRDITDHRLRRLCELRSARWGDEWWTTKQVAMYHGVDVKDVTRLIHLGRIDAVVPPVSRGGRHNNRRWAYWFVRRSVALNLKFKRRGDDFSTFTPRGDAWILRARNELGLHWEDIGRTMKKTGWTIQVRYNKLMSLVGQAYETLQGIA